MHIDKMKNFAAIGSSMVADKFTISCKVGMGSKTKIIDSVCSNTGIVIQLRIPDIPNMALEYTSPLSYYHNVKGIIAQGEKYLKELDLQILAGLWLAVYKHFDLISTKDQSALMLNAMIRTCGTDVIVSSLLTSFSIDSKNYKLLPKLSLDYNIHKDVTVSLTDTIYNYNKILKDILFPAKTVNAFHSPAVIAALSVNKNKNRMKQKDIEKEIEEKIREFKREAKGLINQLFEKSILSIKFDERLRSIFIGDNLIALDFSKRIQYSQKLKEYNNVDCNRLAEIIEEGKNPYSMLFQLDTDIDSPAVTTKAINKDSSKKESLAERIARVKREQAEELNNSYEAAHPKALDDEKVLAYRQPTLVTEKNYTNGYVETADEIDEAEASGAFSTEMENDYDPIAAIAAELDLLEDVVEEEHIPSQEMIDAMDSDYDIDGDKEE
jgi:hypothetical protein